MRFFTSAFFLVAGIVIGMALSGCGSEEVRILQAGPPGADGISCTLDGSILTCGEDSYDFSELAGADGKDGIPGTSCTIERTDDGAEITCGDTKIVINDGKDGWGRWSRWSRWG